MWSRGQWDPRAGEFGVRRAARGRRLKHVVGKVVVRGTWPLSPGNVDISVLEIRLICLRGRRTIGKPSVWVNVLFSLKAGNRYLNARPEVSGVGFVTQIPLYSCGR